MWLCNAQDDPDQAVVLKYSVFLSPKSAPSGDVLNSNRCSLSKKSKPIIFMATATIIHALNFV